MNDIMKISQELCKEYGWSPEQAEQVGCWAQEIGDFITYINKIVRAHPTDDLFSEGHWDDSLSRRALMQDVCALCLSLAAEVRLTYELRDGQHGEELRQKCLNMGVRQALPRVVGFYPVWRGSVYAKDSELKRMKDLTEQELVLWEAARDKCKRLRDSRQEVEA